jgi:hypothetical protein
MPSEREIEDALAFQGHLDDLSEEFNTVCQLRHDMGAKKYGPVNFLEVDSIEMAIEEVIDLANYARYTFIKLRLIQEALKQFYKDQKPEMLGTEGFKKSGS